MMNKHKQIWAVFLFMLLFVQSSLYFTGAQLSTDCLKGEERTFSSGEGQRKASIIAPLTAGDMEQLWTGGKRFIFPDRYISEDFLYGKRSDREDNLQ